MDSLESLLERPAIVEDELTLGERPARKVDVRVDEPRYNAAPPEVNAIRGGERELVRSDAT